MDLNKWWIWQQPPLHPILAHSAAPRLTPTAVPGDNSLRPLPGGLSRAMAVPPISPFGVHHIAIQCRDLPAMVRFYEKVLRLRVERRWPAPEGKGDRSVWVRLGTAVIALEACSGDPQAAPWHDPAAGFHLLAVEIHWANRSIWLAHLHHCGVDIVHESPWTIYVRDPEGNRVGLSHFPFDVQGTRTS